MKTLRIISILSLVVTAMLLLNSCGGVNLNVIEGDLSVLKGVNEISIDFDYSKMAVGEFATEEDYINKKVSEANEKDPGKGEAWREEWNNNKTDYYHKTFVERVNDYLNEIGVSASYKNKSAPYTLIVKPTFLEIGWSAIMVSKPSRMIAEVYVVETGNKKKALAIIQTEEVTGNDIVDARSRIIGAYYGLGRYVGKGLLNYLNP